MNQKNANYIKAVEKIKFIMGDQSIPTLPEVEEQFLELYNQYLGAIEEVEKELSSEDMIFKVKLMILGRFNAWRKKLISLKSVSSVQSSILSFMESMEKEFKPAPIESSKKIQCTCPSRSLFEQGCICGAFKRG